jgi:hypothetical protein
MLSDAETFINLAKQLPGLLLLLLLWPVAGGAPSEAVKQLTDVNMAPPNAAALLVKSTPITVAEPESLAQTAPPTPPPLQWCPKLAAGTALYICCQLLGKLLSCCSRSTLVAAAAPAVAPAAFSLAAVFCQKLLLNKVTLAVDVPAKAPPAAAVLETKVLFVTCSAMQLWQLTTPPASEALLLWLLLLCREA